MLTKPPVPYDLCVVDPISHWETVGSTPVYHSVFYSRPSFMIIVLALASQFHVYLLLGSTSGLSRGLICDYEPSDGLSFQALLEIRLCYFENFCLYDLGICVRPLDSNTWRRQFTGVKPSPEYKVPKLWLKYLNKLRPGHKVVTYSTVENFEFQTWKDFSDLRLIEPSRDYPVIEVGGVQIDSSNCEALICRISRKYSDICARFYLLIISFSWTLTN